MYYFLNRKEINIQLANTARGSANQANISNKIIEQFEFYLPPIEEQNKIANIENISDEELKIIEMREAEIVKILNTK